jgi:hypothetical protein
MAAGNAASVQWPDHMRNIQSLHFVTLAAAILASYITNTPNINGFFSGKTGRIRSMFTGKNVEIK